MRSLFTFSSLVMVAVLSACSKETESVDRSGNCKWDFISAYNAVSMESSSIYRDNSTSLSNACDRLFSKHGGVSCKAEVQYRTQQVSTDDKKAVCSR